MGNKIHDVARIVGEIIGLTRWVWERVSVLFVFRGCLVTTVSFGSLSRSEKKMYFCGGSDSVGGSFIELESLGGVWYLDKVGSGKDFNCEGGGVVWDCEARYFLVGHGQFLFIGEGLMSDPKGSSNGSRS